MERTIVKIGIEFEDGYKVERIHVTGDGVHEHSVEVIRDGVPYIQTEGLDYFESVHLYQLECEEMRAYVANKPKQGTLSWRNI